MKLNTHIVLIGLMGAGKTHVGRVLAQRLNVDFIDSDHEIEHAAGMTISEIFDKFGESYFREGETRVLKRLLGGKPSVVATGGGAFMFEQNRDLITDQGVSVWLEAELDTLYDRTAHTSHRPLLQQGDARQILADLIEKRYPVYGLADITVSSDPEDANIVVDEIIEKIQELNKVK